MADPSPAVHASLTTREVRIVDADGRLRLLLSAADGKPTVTLLRADGQVGASVALDAAGRPAVALSNPMPTGPDATIEIDDKGAHVLFLRPGGASAYLFLNNAGGSGVVMIDAQGRRRIDATVAADGSSVMRRLDDAGRPLP